MYSRFQPSSPNLKQAEQSFEHVLVNLNDGNQFLMSKCSNCGFICRNNMKTKLAHWKRCPSKFSFRYLSQNDVTGRIIVCTTCNMKFFSPDMINMKKHSQVCARITQQPTGTVPYTLSNSYTDSNNRFDTNNTPNAIKNINENIVGRKEIDAQRKVLMAKNGKIPIPGYRIKYVMNEQNVPERHSECLVCSMVFRKPTNYALNTHRQMCTNILISVSTQSMASLPFTTQAASSQPLDSHQQLSYHTMSSHDLLAHSRPSNSMPVQTMSSRQMPSHTIVSQPLTSQPFDSTITSSMSDTGISRFTVSEDTSRFFPSLPVKRCFICNTTSSESFDSLYQTTSMHSETKIYDFVWQFLDDQPSVRDNSTDSANSNWSLVCAECIDMINSYDLARVTAAKFEKCLRDKLSQTETHYMERQGNMRAPLESPTTRAQREREQQQQHSYADRTTPDEVTTRRESGKKYADEPNDAVHYLVELSDDEQNQPDEEEEEEIEEEREGQKELQEQQEQVIEISDEDDA